jgi:sulfur carrier protein
MNVRINGTITQVADNATVADIATENGVGQTGSAIAVNEKLVRRADWPNVTLSENDDIVIIKAAYGG